MSTVEEQNPLDQGEATPPETTDPGEKYPSMFSQDSVGRSIDAAPQSSSPEGEHLLANDGNMLARKDVRWRGGGADAEKPDVEDPEEDGLKPPKSEWDEMFTTDYFTVMGFLFKTNTLRLNQKQLPVAIALLLVIYMFIAIYVLYVILGGMMIHIAFKYKDEQCEENLSQWTLVTGVYICASFLLNVASTLIKMICKKEPLATIQHVGTVFNFVWFIIGLSLIHI
eukprot:TRINITY_DN4862_c0_g1_i2.p1 TRINITY_DN4862_c0_g1~~TRINITY_DN4862_c0_g1_i2.p1  ORF type:complete len:225 (-),score=44.75 TRINITY_DN4862_c0_g1_i2:124-798(-)